MNDKDILQRFLFENASVRGEIVRLNESYQTIIRQHDYPSAIRQLLGEALVAVSLLSATIKFKGRLTIQFRGNAKLKLLLAQCDQALHLRGLVQWAEGIGQEDIYHAFHKGLLAILMDPEDQAAKRYEGIVAWEGQSLAESIENYFKNSEQLATRLWIAVDQSSAVGLLLQVLPDNNSDTHQENWDHLIHLSSTLTPQELLTLDNQTLLHRLYAEEDIRLFESEPVTFQCTCSVERSENALLLLEREEVERELKDKQKIVVTCDFCNKEYHFDRVDIARIFNRGEKSSGSLQ